MNIIVLFILLCGVFAARGSIIVVELDGEDPSYEKARRFAQEHSLELLSKEDTQHLPANVWAFRAEPHRTRSVVERLDASDQVKWHEVQHKRRRYTRSLPLKKKKDSFLRRAAPLLGNPRTAGSGASDPLYASQWHLHGNANSLNVESAWGEHQVTGKRVTVAIVDDGVQVRHPDLNVNREHSKDFNNGRGTDCSPYTTDGHGTSAAGVCCAVRNNGQCGAGVAPDATLVGIRLIAEPTTDLEESTALSYKSRDIIDVYSNSWGPMDDASDLQGPGRLTKMVFEQNTHPVTGGRNGKGSIYVWAGGNGRENEDNCNYDGYANSIYTIAVGAIDHLGYQSWYSEPCSALLVVAPSSGSQLGITTTDLTGYNGYSNGQCCSSFGGTSSAAPAVAGTIALLLQKRPDLTWRDVQHVLAKSSVMPPAASSDRSSSNEKGYVHSERFGFGRVDVPSMLTLAQHYTLVPAQKKITIVLSSTNRNPHNGNARPKATGTFNMQEDLSFVEHVTLSLDVLHKKRGNLKISLISPRGIISTLFEPHSADANANIPSSHTFMSVRHWGDQLRTTQKWTLEVEDTNTLGNVFYGTGYLQSATLTIYGY